MMTLTMNMLNGEPQLNSHSFLATNLFPFMFQQLLSRRARLRFILTLSGFSILLARFIMVLHDDRQRSWHLSRIEKSTKLKSGKITIKTANEILEKLPKGKEKKLVFVRATVITKVVSLFRFCRGICAG